ncbi:hypothetical protein ON010_g18163 [Phytophthora cinnamomi]|nr:hypothetical protein ON010_g18163 [Phytophthora cinnamomi]
MGAKQSALKKEIAALHQEARKRSAKHQEELAAAAKEKRLLQVKIDELQASVTTAQEEAVKMKSEAREREERMKALKWELVRQIKMSGSPTSSPRASLSPSSSARISLNWKLNDDVTLRHSVVSPTKKPSIGDTVERCIEKSPTQAVEAPKKEPNTGDAADSRSDTSSAPSTGRSSSFARQPEPSRRRQGNQPNVRNGV